MRVKKLFCRVDSNVTVYDGGRGGGAVAVNNLLTLF